MIDRKYWMDDRGKWDGHLAFATVYHCHVCHYGGAGEEICDIMVVECRNGKYYVEDNWGGDAPEDSIAWNPYIRDSEPVFLDSYEEADLKAREIVALKCGVLIETVS